MGLNSFKRMRARKKAEEEARKLASSKIVEEKVDETTPIVDETTETNEVTETTEVNPIVDETTEAEHLNKKKKG